MAACPEFIADLLAPKKSYFFTFMPETPMLDIQPVLYDQVYKSSPLIVMKARQLGVTQLTRALRDFNYKAFKQIEPKMETWRPSYASLLR